MNKSFSYIFFCIFLIGFQACKKPVESTQDKPKSNIEQNLVDANRILVKKDKQRIVAQIERLKWNMKESPTGLWYEIIENGTGDSVKTGQTVTLDFKVTLLDGTECYNSAEDGELTFTVGKGNVETGLEQGILYLQQGSRARFILPPYLAHGLTGDGNRIPARAILIYEVFVVSLNNS